MATNAEMRAKAKRKLEEQLPACRNRRERRRSLVHVLNRLS
jgi:hypothetical protein